MERTIIRTDRLGGMTRSYYSDQLDGEATALARQTLEGLKGRGVLTGGDFDSDTWCLDDERKTRRLSFRIDPGAYAAGAGRWSGCTLEEYTTTMKVYTALQLGTAILDTLAASVKEARDLAVLPPEKLVGAHPGARAMTILCYLPHTTPEREAFLEDVEAGPTVSTTPDNATRRTLPEIAPLLRFASWLEEYWKLADARTRVWMFPVRLWWQLTSVLPLRPTEFILTPRDCIRGNPGAYTMDVMRTNLKKHTNQVFYRVAGDYHKDTYQVPDSLAEDVLWFIDNTEPGPGASGERLLGDGRTMGYAAMRELLRAVSEGCAELGDASIHLGDTRHLAMINLIISGGSPSVCRQLANHESIAQSSWYYTNIESIVGSESFLGPARSRGIQLIQSDFRLVPAGVPTHEVPGGRCDAMGVPEGNVSACLSGASPGRHLGECTGCPHFYPRLEAQRAIRSQGSDLVRLDTLFLGGAVDQYREAQGLEGTLQDLFRSAREKYARSIPDLGTAGKGKDRGMGNDNAKGKDKE